MSGEVSGRARARSAHSPAGWAAMAGVLALMLAAGVIAEVVTAGQPAAPAAAEPVRTATLSCPGSADPAGSGDPGDATVTVAAPPRPARPDGTVAAGAPAPSGRATVADLDGARVRARLSGPGLGRAELPAVGRGQVVRADGALAPGIAAETVTAGTSRGVAAVTCGPPGTGFWFTGAATGPNRRDQLVLTNLESTPAVADLRIWAADGPVDAPNSEDIAVAAGQERRVELGELAPDRDRLTIAVQVTRGRVAAALHDVRAGRGARAGTDWIAPGDPPARQVVIPGLPGGDLDRRLRILAPGRTDAIVTVRLLTADGDFAPAGLQTLTAAAGTVTETDLDEAVAGELAGIVLQSDQPIVAGVQVSGADLAHAGSVGALTRPAVIPDAGGAGPGGTRLLFSAPGPDSGEVTWTTFTASGQTTTETTTVPAGHVVAVDPAAAGAERFAVVVRPGPDGPVHAVRLLRSGDGYALTPLVGERFTVVVPSVVGDLGASLPR